MRRSKPEARTHSNNPRTPCNQSDQMRDNSINLPAQTRPLHQHTSPPVTEKRLRSNPPTSATARTFQYFVGVVAGFMQGKLMQLPLDDECLRVSASSSLNCCSAVARSFT